MTRLALNKSGSSLLDFTRHRKHVQMHADLSGSTRRLLDAFFFKFIFFSFVYRAFSMFQCRAQGATRSERWDSDE